MIYYTLKCFKTYIAVANFFVTVFMSAEWIFGVVFMNWFNYVLNNDFENKIEHDFEIFWKDLKSC